MKRTAITRPKPQPGILRTASLKAGKPMKSRGMKGRAPTAAERALHHDMAGLGCMEMQDDTDPLQRVAVHPNKARFEAQYGSQESLLALARERLGR